MSLRLIRRPLHRSAWVPSTQPILPSGTQLLTCSLQLVLRSDLVEFLSPLFLRNWWISLFAYCMCLLAADKRKMPKNRVNKGKKSPANQGDSLGSLSILLESVMNTMILRYLKYMHVY